MFGLDKNLLTGYERVLDRVFEVMIEPLYCTTEKEGLDHLTEEFKTMMKNSIETKE